MTLKDFLGHTVTPAVEPLSLWGWVGCIFATAVAVAGCFLAALYWRGPAVKAAGKGMAFIGLSWMLFAFLSPLFRAVGPGFSIGWWVTSGVFIVAIGFAFSKLSDRYHYDLPSPIFGLLAPFCGWALAVVSDLAFEGLTRIPLSTTTIGWGLFIAFCIAAYMAVSSKR